MLNYVKRSLGYISTSVFDDDITMMLNAGVRDLMAQGIVFEDAESDPLIFSAVTTYALMRLDTENAEMYADSYRLQKDELRHLVEYN